MAKRSRQSTTWWKHVTGYALNKGAFVGTDHVKTRFCASRSRSMMDIRQKSPKKTVSALLNYSKAFGGMTCRPIAYAQLVRDLLSNRKTKVQVNGDRGRQLPLRQGLPQGVVLSPLHFLLYIKDFRWVKLGNVDMAMFSDKVTLFSSHTRSHDKGVGATN